MAVRQAVRAVLVDPAGSVFLMRIVDPATAAGWWIAPGGGIDDGEDHLTALLRELGEELGLQIPADRVGPPLWHRHISFTWDGRSYRQHETFYLVETERFDPLHCRDGDPGDAPVPAEPGWWTSDELRRTTDHVAPADLADLLDGLRTQGVPSPVIDLDR